VRISLRKHRLQLEVPFAIARGTTSAQTVCIAEIEHGGAVGLGEASPSAYYGDSIEAASEAIEGAGPILGDDPFAIHAISVGLRQRFPGSPSGRAAVETALWDIAGKIAGLPLFQMLGLAGLPLPRTSFTVGVDDVGLARRRVHRLSDFPILKVKVGFGAEEELLGLLRRETGAVLRVDANEGWQADQAVEKIRAWKEYGIEFFEQPLAKLDKDGYKKIKRQTDAVVFVDEGVTTSADIAQWVGLADGINIKLMKCGGLSEALRMIAVARAFGLRVMLGCMVESSLGITAAAHLAPLADFCDLDGNLLISNDPFVGVRAPRGVLTLPQGPGLGVTPRDPVATRREA
jgi:L-alanine-DL-glutamate epimerase-like enolase superfamily enzyme